MSEKLPKKSTTDDQNNVQYISTRTILFIMIFLGFGVNFMVRVNLNITIVDMIKEPKSIENKSIARTSSSRINTTSTFDTKSNENHKYSFEKVILNYFNMTYDEHGFDWNEHQKGLLFGAFFWLNWVTQIHGGVWSQKYGAKLVFGLSNFLGSVICFVIPMAAYIDFKLMVAMRVLQGLITVRKYSNCGILKVTQIILNIYFCLTMFPVMSIKDILLYKHCKKNGKIFLAFC